MCLSANTRPNAARWIVASCKQQLRAISHSGFVRVPAAMSSYVWRTHANAHDTTRHVNPQLMSIITRMPRCFALTNFSFSRTHARVCDTNTQTHTHREKHARRMRVPTANGASMMFGSSVPHCNSAACVRACVYVRFCAGNDVENLKECADAAERARARSSKTWA